MMADGEMGDRMMADGVDGHMYQGTDRITKVRTVTIKHMLATPIVYGEWVMRHREFALVGIDAESGLRGFAYCLTRDGPVAEIVSRSIAPVYVGSPVTAPEDVFYRALWTNHAVHAAGIGMRALSVVDIAAWDLAAKAAGQSIAGLLGGSLEPLPATAIVGYPPTISAAETAEQVGSLWQAGWRRFKVPISPTLDHSVQRLEAVRAAAPDGWVGFDLNMVLHSAAEVLDFEKRVRHLRLGWIEDVVPPGDAAMVAAVRQGSETPVAMGDEQGGSYHPEALLAMDAVDVLRVDATTNGGVTRLRGIVKRARDKGVPVSPHMFPHVHSRVMAALGCEAPIEWGIPGTGVHPMDDCLDQPVVRDGYMEPLPGSPGFGVLAEPGWIANQVIKDPEGLLDDL
jgi:L-alanine-DL-glutamate epimerase-like enolase superfamily enzyme